MPEVDIDEEDVINHEHLKPGDHVVVQLKGQKNIFHYAARIDDPVSEDNDVGVTYLERKFHKYDQDELQRFIIPEKSKSYQVPLEDIVKKLPAPLIPGGTKRISRQITFQMSFVDYNLA
jgi:hypothetical protein